MSRERKVYTKEFKLMSVELSNTRSDLSALAREYIETWYNRKSQHSALGYLSPEQFARKINKQNIAA